MAVQANANSLLMLNSRWASQSCHGVVWRRLAEPVRITATALILLVAVAFAGRRLAGAFVEPLGGGEFLGVAAGLAMLAAALQLGAPVGPLSRAIPAVAAVATLAAITVPGTSPWAVTVAWFTLGALESIVLLLPHQRRQRLAPPQISAAIDAEEAEPGEQLVQQLTRRRADSGGELIHALVRAECPAGDRRVAVHLAFCPPLEAIPRLAAHVLDDRDAEATISLAATYGARIEIRLKQAAAIARPVLLEVSGESGTTQPGGD